MKWSGTIWRSERGSALITSFVVIGLVAFLFNLAMDRTLGERGLVQGFYYDQVALDLAESGVNLAIASLQGGTIPAAGKASMDFGEFRNLKGSVQASVSSTQGGYRILSRSVLKDRSGKEQFRKSLVVTGHVAPSGSTRIFKIDSWQEPSQP